MSYGTQVGSAVEESGFVFALEDQRKKILNISI